MLQRILTHVDILNRLQVMRMFDLLHWGTSGAAKHWTHPDAYFNCSGYWDFIHRCDSTEVGEGLMECQNAERSFGQMGIESDAVGILPIVMRTCVGGSFNGCSAEFGEILFRFNGESGFCVGRSHSQHGVMACGDDISTVRFHGGPSVAVGGTHRRRASIRDVDKPSLYGRRRCFCGQCCSSWGYDGQLHSVNSTSMRGTEQLGRAGIGMFQEVHAMKQGALILNDRRNDRLDFAVFCCYDEPCVAFESFRDWENEIGRVTFYADSSFVSLKKADLHLPFRGLNWKCGVLSNREFCFRGQALPSSDQSIEVRGFSQASTTVLLWGWV